MDAALVLIGVLWGAVLGAAALYWATDARRYVRAQRRLRKASERVEQTRQVECRRCYEQLPVDQAHIVVAHLVDGDEADLSRTGGGTAMVAEYHAGHCPGGCTRGCPIPVDEWGDPVGA